MPKYYKSEICGYILYFTAKCTEEAMHVHASDKKMTRENAAKFWVYSDGTVKVDKRGMLKREIYVRYQISYLRITLECFRYGKDTVRMDSTTRNKFKY